MKCHSCGSDNREGERVGKCTPRIGRRIAASPSYVPIWADKNDSAWSQAVDIQPVGMSHNRVAHGHPGVTSSLDRCSESSAPYRVLESYERLAERIDD